MDKDSNVGTTTRGTPLLVLPYPMEKWKLARINCNIFCVPLRPSRQFCGLDLPKIPLPPVPTSGERKEQEVRNGTLPIKGTAKLSSRYSTDR